MSDPVILGAVALLAIVVGFVTAISWTSLFFVRRRREATEAVFAPPGGAPPS